MYFRLILECEKPEYVCMIPTTEIGACDVQKIRCEKRADVPLRVIDSWKRGIYYYSIEIEVPEKIALGLPEFAYRNVIKAYVPEHYLNDCVEEMIDIDTDDVTGECISASISWTIDKMDALLKWIEDDEYGIGAYRRERQAEEKKNDA